MSEALKLADQLWTLQEFHVPGAVAPYIRSAAEMLRTQAAEIESLRAERDAVMEKHFQAVEAQVKLIHERDALKQKLGPALEAALGELMYGTCPKAITIVKAAIDAAKEQQ